MKTTLLIAALLCCVSISGCAEHPVSPGRIFKSAVWDLKKSLRSPGQKLVASPEAVQKQHTCDSKVAPHLELDGAEVLPPETKADREVNHRFTYTLCSQNAAAISYGTLTRRVVFDGQLVFEDVTQKFPLNPGRWSVDAFIAIPKKAPQGVYALECKFDGVVRFSVTRTFVVVK